jgi:hypothetical protein
MLDADAQLIATLKGCDFRGHYEATHDYSPSIFFVPDDVLLREEASGSDLVCLRGGWEALKALALTPESRAAVAQAKFYDQSMSEYPGFMASRRNDDVAQGIDSDGRRRSGVLESSWHAGGASSTELAALAEFAQNPMLQVVEASAVEEFGRDHEPPADAIIHFAGEDPQLGPLLRHTVVKRKKSHRG